MEITKRYITNHEQLIIEVVKIISKYELNCGEILFDYDTTPYVCCNDVFAWAMGDFENLTTDDIPDLITALEECDPIDIGYGPHLWACRKRKLRPQVAYCNDLPKKLKNKFMECGTRENQFPKPKEKT